MILCELTELTTKKPVYLNPSQVVTVQQVGSSTLVWTTAINNDGASHVLVVAEPPEIVVRKIDAAASGLIS